MGATRGRVEPGDPTSLAMAASRRLLKVLASRFTLRIRRGPLKGLRWIVGSGGRFIGGRYDPPSVEALKGAVGPGDVVFDVGAHVGYLTAVASLAAGPEGRVYSFEPLPLNLLYLRRHVRLNRLDNVTILEAAAGMTGGSAGFREGTGTGTGRLARESETGDLQVRQVVLDELVESGELEPPDVLKVDVEGAEVMVLRGAMRILKSHRPTLLLSTHGPEAHRESLELLEQVGYDHHRVGAEKRPGELELLARPRE